MRDRLFVRGLRLFGRHGVLRAERTLGQLFVVDVDVFADVRAAGAHDDFGRTLNYVTVFDVARGVVEGEPRHLVEAVAHSIADELFVRLPAAHSVRVCVKKPHVALPAALDAVGVEIYRRNHARVGDGESVEHRASAASPVRHET
ncbi:unnamed protein product [Agarophyton chilense]|eukprot:gb/GEZJ01005566.1/.p2 GENE.gb/GEZJ01005566.1/~~gb/GEZJ01005566.1/.p2  ORF type:complete len:145 (-),score=23.82 gb/GEZJ01005566.1/:210-644(-)